jgi:multidrug resistance efflux pump
MRFMPGEALYQVADLSAVWVVADVFEQDIGLVKVGAGAKVKINAYPDKTFEGTITYVYPTLNSGDSHHSGPRRTRQSRAIAQARHVRPGGSLPSRRKGAVGHGADLGRHRQRHPPASC